MSGIPIIAQGAALDRSSGRTYAAIALCLVAAVAGFWPTVSTLLELWGNPQRQTYQHGYLVAAISLWLIVRDRRHLAALAGRGSYVLLTVAGLASLTWAVALQGGIQTLHMAIWPVAVWAAMASLLGWRAGLSLAFPVGYLYFAVPVWDVFTPLLQWATVAANAVLTQVAGIPAFIQGDEVHIPSGTFVIEGRCSGLNYFVASLAIGALYGEIHRDPLQRRLLQVALIALLAMVTNWARVFAVIVAGHLTDMQHYLVRVDHQDFGWVLFAVVLLVFFLIVRRWPQVDGESRDARVGPTDALRGPATILWVVGLAAMLAGPLLVLRADSRPDTGTIVMEIPDWPGWTLVEEPGRQWHPLYPGADAERRVDLRRDGFVVRVYSAGYSDQDQSKELSGHGVSLLGQGSWSWAGPARTVILASNSTEIHWSEREATLGAQRALVWWTYQVGARHIADAFKQQLWFGLASLQGQPVSGIVALSADCVDDCQAARQQLQALAAAGVPRISTTKEVANDRS